MIKQFFITVLVLCVCWSCNRLGKPKKPDNLIEKDKMTAILYDVFVLNAAKGTDRRLLERNGIMPETYIFEKYGIDSLQFATSNNYYAYDVKTYENILDNIQTRLKTTKDHYQKIIDDEKKRNNQRRDSINRASDSLKIQSKDIKQ